MFKHRHSYEEIAALLRYDASTGKLYWRSTGRGRREGAEAGGVSKEGYVRISVHECRYQAHRLAFLLHYGRWPSGQIDHFNLVKTDNRISNLRECSNAENQLNRRRYKNNRSGYQGVSRMPSGRWRATITIDGRSVWIGAYDSPEEAHQAFLEAKRKMSHFQTHVTS